MAVDDHGLEVLKKAGEEVITGNKSDYFHKIAGTDSANAIPVKVEFAAVPIININNDAISSGINDEITVGTSETELKIGASNLTSRNFLSAIPQDGGIFFSLTTGVTALTGTPILQGQPAEFKLKDDTIVVFAIAAASVKVRLFEAVTV